MLHHHVHLPHSSCLPLLLLTIIHAFSSRLYCITHVYHTFTLCSLTCYHDDASRPTGSSIYCTILIDSSGGVTCDMVVAFDIGIVFKGPVYRTRKKTETGPNRTGPPVAVVYISDWRTVVAGPVATGSVRNRSATRWALKIPSKWALNHRKWSRFDWVIKFLLKFHYNMRHYAKISRIFS